MIMTTRSRFVVDMLLFFQSQMHVLICQAAQEERDEEMQEQVSTTEAGCP